ncbi:hypothetical protein [Flavobacterium sp.]
MAINNEHLPSVDIDFIIENISNSSKVIKNSKLAIGSTTTFMLEANKAFHKRIINIRSLNGQVNFMQATALAINHGFMGALLDWYRDNRDWNEGGYTTPKAKK